LFPWQRGKQQVVLQGYALELNQAVALETYMREHSIAAFVCPSVENEAYFSVSVWLKDRDRALRALAVRRGNDSKSRGVPDVRQQ
jgi:hypothetical protein